MDEAERLNEITRKIIGCAITVHRTLGPGLLESAYQACLAAEFRATGLKFREQVDVPVRYRGQVLGSGYRLDFIVEDEVIIEIKSVERMERIHKAQLLSYLRLERKRVGLLLNFNVEVLRSGLHRVVNDFPELGALSASALEVKA
ncbi:MAG TPA: GxxExxY protein [Terriglobales bacterium]|jgi:GxxExxY protein|nr:GxxExxY protein [Terriglobales bacterium]